MTFSLCFEPSSISLQEYFMNKYKCKHTWCWLMEDYEEISFFSLQHKWLLWTTSPRVFLRRMKSKKRLGKPMSQQCLSPRNTENMYSSSRAGSTYTVGNPDESLAIVTSYSLCRTWGKLLFMRIYRIPYDLYLSSFFFVFLYYTYILLFNIMEFKEAYIYLIQRWPDTGLICFSTILASWLA